MRFLARFITPPVFFSFLALFILYAMFGHAHVVQYINHELPKSQVKISVSYDDSACRYTYPLKLSVHNTSSRKIRFLFASPSAIFEGVDYGPRFGDLVANQILEPHEKDSWCFPVQRMQHGWEQYTLNPESMPSVERLTWGARFFEIEVLDKILVE
jgi:hypothetical protein